MKTEYDLSKLKSRKNPYASKLKKPDQAPQSGCQPAFQAGPVQPRRSQSAEFNPKCSTNGSKSRSPKSSGI